MVEAGHVLNPYRSSDWSNLGSIESWNYRPLDPSNLGSIEPWIYQTLYLSIFGSIKPWIYRPLDPSNLGYIKSWIYQPLDVSILDLLNLGSIESWGYRTLDPSNLGSIHFWIHRIYYLTLDQSNLGSIGMPPFHEEDETLYALYGWCVLRDITSTFSSSFFSLAVDCEWSECLRFAFYRWAACRVWLAVGYSARRIEVPSAGNLELSTVSSVRFVLTLRA